ncbi:MAG: hypothetical protein AAGC64_04520 [Bacteroidota bacterium]
MKKEIISDKDYIEAFNQGYELHKELGLKPDILKDLSAGNKRILAMQDGMEQYGRELIEKQKEATKDVIPPLDLDSLDNTYIDVDVPDKDKNKGMDMDL